GGIVIPPGVCGRIWVKHSPVISNNQGRAICSDLHSEPLNARPIYICSGLVTGVCSIRSSQTDCLASPEKAAANPHSRKAAANVIDRDVSVQGRGDYSGIGMSDSVRSIK